MVVAILAPILVYIYPPQSANKKQDLRVALDKPLDQLQEGDAVKFEAPANTGFLMVDGGGDNYAGAIAFGAYAVKQAGGAITVFAINCSHLGCSIAFNAGARRFDCPCHGSQFGLNGQVVHGPAVFPLSNLAWKQGATTGEIVVGGVSLPGIG